MFNENYYRDHLNIKEKAVYNQILRAWKGHKNNLITLPTAEESMKRIVRAVQADHPEIHWVTPTYRYTRTAVTHYSVALRFTMTSDPEQSRIKTRELSWIADNLVHRASMLGSEVEKARFFFDWLNANVEYDGDVDSYAGSQTSYGALVERRSACAGFSAAMTLLCQRSGIACISVYGNWTDTDNTVTPHAWNIVTADNISFHCDCASSFFTDENGEQVPISLCFAMTDEAVCDAGYSTDEPKNIYPVCNADCNSFTNHVSYGVYDFDSALWKCFADVENGRNETVISFRDRTNASRFYNEFNAHAVEYLDVISDRLGGSEVYCAYTAIPIFKSVVLRWRVSAAA